MSSTHLYALPKSYRLVAGLLPLFNLAELHLSNNLVKNHREHLADMYAVNDNLFPPTNSSVLSDEVACALRPHDLERKLLLSANRIGHSIRHTFAQAMPDTSRTYKECAVVAQIVKRALGVWRPSNASEYLDQETNQVEANGRLLVSMLKQEGFVMKQYLAGQTINLRQEFEGILNRHRLLALMVKRNCPLIDKITNQPALFERAGGFLVAYRFTSHLAENSAQSSFFLSGVDLVKGRTYYMQEAAIRQQIQARLSFFFWSPRAAARGFFPYD